MELRGQCHAPAALLPGKAASTYCIGVGRAPQPVWTGAENIAPKRDSILKYHDMKS